jgi:hypothetical protein
MLENVIVNYHQVHEAWSRGGLKDVLRPRVFFNRIATPAEMDLSRPIAHPADLLENSAYRFVELKLEDLLAGKWSFAVAPILQALPIRKGWRNFAGRARRSSVSGVIVSTSGNIVAHPDLRSRNQCKEKEVYAFVLMRLNIVARTLPFRSSVLTFSDFGKSWFLLDDNLPALADAHMLKYKELPSVVCPVSFLHKYEC